MVLLCLGILLYNRWNEIHEATVRRVPVFVFSAEHIFPTFGNITGWKDARFNPELISVGLGDYPLHEPICK